MQAVIWNTWGPIAQSAKEVFGWDDGQVAMLPNWGNIGFIATVFVASYCMDEKGNIYTNCFSTIFIVIMLLYIVYYKYRPRPGYYYI